MVICGHSHGSQTSYMKKLEKVKFGVPASEAFSQNDIPPTLLILLLKVNKEGSFKKDIWRAPGNQAHVRKLIHIMEHGRLVNIANFSVYTAASVIKKFLGKLPGGIFGFENERKLFQTLDCPDDSQRRESISRVFQSLSVPSQHLLVLLFGTFALVAESCDPVGTRMSPEAIGVSVAPSLFHTCVMDGHRAHIEDVARFRNASRIVTFIVEQFGCTDLFPRENYEYYARITARTLHLTDSWKFTFRDQYMYFESREDRQAFLDKRAVTNVERIRALSHPEVVVTSDISSTPFRNGSGLNAGTCMSLEELKEVNQRAESTRSLSFLGEVHERQRMRMENRSAWFLTPEAHHAGLVLGDLNRCLGSGSILSGPVKEVGSATRRRSWRKHYQRPRSSLSDHPGSNQYSVSLDSPFHGDEMRVAVSVSPDGEEIKRAKEKDSCTKTSVPCPPSSELTVGKLGELASLSVETAVENLSPSPMLSSPPTDADGLAPHSFTSSISSGSPPGRDTPDPAADKNVILDKGTDVTTTNEPEEALPRDSGGPQVFHF